MAKSIWDLEEEDYVDKWKTYVNEQGQEVHENEVLGMKITKLNLSEQEIEEKFNIKLANLS
ncbi:hypothetical protein [Bacteroides ovatus]|uniref:hypothetical protein n=1 Tax=Bacteroides ovatus TaxID=28116 RepID=UPI00189CB89A|nr:hypothetical protein [Bacteroides ovatus]